jgi:ankyrin repeat protein
MKSLMTAALIWFLACSAHAAYVGIDAAAADGDLDGIKQYLASDPTLLSSRNGPGRTPLCIAAMRGQTNAVAFLISQGADVNDKGFEEMTPLADMASAWGLRDDDRCVAVARILLEHGAKIDPVDVYGKTPMLWAAESGKPRLVQVLLEHGADMTARVPRGVARAKTALHLAVENHQKEVVQVLLKFKAPLDAVDYNGSTPLDLAAGQATTEIADLIRVAMQSSGQDVPVKPPQPPTREAMRAIAQRIANGDAKAFHELAEVTENMYRGIKDYQKERLLVMLNLSRMKAAFDLLGEEAGKGNGKAFEALKQALAAGRLASFAPDAFGIAAATGNKDALDILLHSKQWGILESSTIFALSKPVKAGVDPAIDGLAAWLFHLKPHASGGMVMDATNALADAAAKGNQKAKEVLKKFAAASVNENP